MVTLEVKPVDNKKVIGLIMWETWMSVLIVPVLPVDAAVIHMMKWKLCPAAVGGDGKFEYSTFSDIAVMTMMVDWKFNRWTGKEGNIAIHRAMVPVILTWDCL